MPRLRVVRNRLPGEGDHARARSKRWTPVAVTNHTSFHSHPEEPAFYSLGIAPQLYIAFTMLALIALASWLALRPRARWVS